MLYVARCSQTVRLLGRMVYSRMLSRVALVITDISEERSASVIRVRGAKFLRNVGYYKSRTA
jgi:hypothetical protein